MSTPHVRHASQRMPFAGHIVCMQSSTALLFAKKSQLFGPTAVCVIIKSIGVWNIQAVFTTRNRNARVTGHRTAATTEKAVIAPQQHIVQNKRSQVSI